MLHAMPDTGREPRIDARRNIEAVLQAAQVLLAEDPKATMGEIAERAQVDRRTLNRRFPSRDALIDELLRRLMRTASELVAQADVESVDAREGLRRATHAWIVEARNWRAARYAPLGALPRGTPANIALRDRLVDLIERGQREQTIRSDLSAQELVEAWTALIITGMAADSGRTSEQIADFIVTVLAGWTPA